MTEELKPCPFCNSKKMQTGNIIMKWISVKEKKPKNDGLLWACHEKCSYAFLCHYNSDKKMFIAYVGILHTPVMVTHYIYLPETPCHIKQMKEWDNPPMCLDYSKKSKSKKTKIQSTEKVTKKPRNNRKKKPVVEVQNETKT